MPAVPSEADVIFNRASVALAKSQRLIASWLPPKTPEELASTKTEEELEREEKAIFAPVPELLGVGAPIPKVVADGSFKRRELSSNEKLLRQLIGSKAAKAHLNSKPTSKHAAPTKNPTSKPLKAPPKKEDSEDEEEGRSSMFKSKRQKTRKPIPKDVREDEEDVNGEAFVKPSIQYQHIKSSGNHTSTEPVKGKKRARDVEDEGESDSDEGVGKGKDTKGSSSSRPKGRLDKKPTNYLDEILSERKKKKKKKSKDIQMD